MTSSLVGQRVAAILAAQLAEFLLRDGHPKRLIAVSLFSAATDTWDAGCRHPIPASTRSPARRANVDERARHVIALVRRSWFGS